MYAFTLSSTDRQPAAEMDWHTSGHPAFHSSDAGSELLDLIQKHVPCDSTMNEYFAVGSTGYIDPTTPYPEGYRGYTKDSYERIVCILGPYMVFQRMRNGTLVMLREPDSSYWKQYRAEDWEKLHPYLTPILLRN